MAPDKTRWIRHGLFAAYHEHGTVVSEGHDVDCKEDGLLARPPSEWDAAEGCYRAGQGVGVSDSVNLPVVSAEALLRSIATWPH